MPDHMSHPTVLRVADLPQHRATPFLLVPGKEELAEIAEALGILGVRKLSFEGTVAAQGKSDWRLVAKLGATVRQSCVVTLEPVTTRIDQPVSRRFVAAPGPEFDEETEMPGDDSEEPLGAEIDLVRVMTEALALALPDYPRKEDAALPQSEFSAPGVPPMRDADVKPFAGLAQLKNKLEKGE